MLSRGHLPGVAAAVVFTLLLLGEGARGSYCWDHQRETYHPWLNPASCSQTCSVIPFFSPDTSIDAYVSLIEAARTSIDIYTPSMKSWNSVCTKDTDCPKRGSCTGCPLEQQRNETFPVFPALLNAVHERGVRVRIITNNFTFSACAGRVIPMDWLALNNIQIRMYTTTTFMHAKFIVIDRGTKTAVSSVNWSYTSFMRNREAGVIVEDCDCSAISFYQSVFQHDWGKGIEYVISRQYSQSEVKIITDPSLLPYTIPKSEVNGTFVTKLVRYSGVKIKKAYTTPDNARETLLAYLGQTEQSLNLAVYQVTDEGLCSELLNLHKRGINVTVLVSAIVIPEYNRLKANECYKNLTDGGMKGRVQRANHNFQFSHEKYWIIDGTTLHLSTGNWSPGDYPPGQSWEPRRKSGHSVNRDLEIVLEQERLVAYFSRVYNADWAMGEQWEPTEN
jgi:phosphatidylserine/phosphatidylglycerophosphate/cardiolipin synthase-like enzyme